MAGEVETNPAETPGATLTLDERDGAAEEAIAQGRKTDLEASQGENDKEGEDNEPAAAPAEPEPASAEPEKVQPYGEKGESVDYFPGNGQSYPALVTHVDEATGLVCLCVFYKSHLDFIGEVSSQEQEDRAKEASK